EKIDAFMHHQISSKMLNMTSYFNKKDISAKLTPPGTPGRKVQAEVTNSGSADSINNGNVYINASDNNATDNIGTTNTTNNNDNASMDYEEAPRHEYSNLLEKARNYLRQLEASDK